MKNSGFPWIGELIYEPVILLYAGDSGFHIFSLVLQRRK